MAKAGDMIENPAAGERIVWRKTAAGTDGKLIEFDQFIKPGGNKTAEHIHFNFEEIYQIVSGPSPYSLNGVAGRALPGERIVIPAGVKHINPWNDGSTEIQVICQVIPDMGTETFYETLYGLARDGKLTANHTMHFWQLVVLAYDLPGRTFFTSQPIWLQRDFLPLLALIGRLMGYKPRYEQYSGPA